MVPYFGKGVTITKNFGRIEGGKEKIEARKTRTDKKVKGLAKSPAPYLLTH
jgi:hypothetical protein